MGAAIAAARKYLFSQQHEEGYWCGELEADTTLESDYILLHTLLGTGNQERFQKAANWILRHQNEDGGWSIYAGGPSNISASVKAYFGLKLAGYTADHPALERARKKILEMGGVTEVNTFTKIYLCFFGQYDYDAVPAIPPEIVLFPNWFWFNIYEISSWSRAILVPLSICYAKKPFKKIPREMGVEELFVGGMQKSRMHLHWAKKLVSWRNFFLVLDRMTHWFERVHVRPLRSIALKKRGEMDAGALRDERRAGRDLSVDDERDHRAALPGIFARRSAGDSRDGRVREAWASKRKTPSACSPACRRCGIRRMRCLRWARREFRRTIRGW